ncbi:MAG: Bacterial membrane protein YfhO [Firmicutes bacterium ADurb.Bin300]|nr:MAG: Bacterial membrane protein YfhO [Firmicutes bacterium ADurb.Bin300]
MKKKNYYKNYPILFSAVFTAAVLLMISAVKGFFPFGDASLAVGDAVLQYVPLLSELRDRLFDGGIFSYSFSSGLGFDFFTAGVYYFLSPFTVLSVLVPGLTAFEAFDLAVMLKVIAAACCFSYYLKISLPGKDSLIPAFSVCYALCGFFTGYSSNIMWLDALIFLPLIALGIERIVEERGGVLYCAALGVAIITSFYTGYMLCIFSVLYFLIRIFGSEGLTSSHNKIASCKPPVASDEDGGEDLYEGRALLPILLKFGGYSLLAGALSAVTLIPLFSALGNSFIKFGEEDTFLFGLADFFTGHLMGTNSVGSYGSIDIPHPFFYCGFLILLLVPLFMLVKKIKLSERVAYCALTLLLILSLLISKANLVWHGISVPAGFPYRFVFLYVFLICVMAYRVFRHLDSIKGIYIASTGVLSIVVCLSLLFQSNEFYTTKIALLNILFIVLICAALLLYKYRNKKRAAILAVTTVLVLAEAFTNAAISVTVNEKDRISILEQQQACVKTVLTANEKSLQRSEVVGDKLAFGLKGSFFGCNGISTFSSLSDEILTFSIGGLGLSHNTQNAIIYGKQTPVFDSFFALKYLYDFSDEDRDDTYYKPLDLSDEDKAECGLNAYEYKYPLPLAFAVNEGITDWLATMLSGFKSQNSLFENATGIKDVFTRQEPGEIKAQNAETDLLSHLIKEDESIMNMTPEMYAEFTRDKYLIKYTKPETVKVTNTFKVETDEPVYLIYSSDMFNNLTILAGGGKEREILYMQNLAAPLIPLIGIKKGDTVTLTAELSDSAKQEYLKGKKIDKNESIVQFSFYSLDEEKFFRGYEYLKEGALKIEEYDGSYIKGTVAAKENQMIFTSIPYSDGWSAYIDGEEVEVLCPEDTHLILLDVEAGQHTLEMKYEVPGLKIGLMVSAASAVLLMLFILLEYKRDRK